MTGRTYKTAQGKTIDLGQLILNNEHVRAVGNMNVNARGDRLDSNNNVIDPKSQQVQRQNQQQISKKITDKSGQRTVHTSNIEALQNILPTDIDSIDNVPDSSINNNTLPIEATAPTTTPIAQPVYDIPTSGGGLAAAIARSRTIMQEKEKTPREIKQFKPGVNRI